jgi:hypothetical protein
MRFCLLVSAVVMLQSVAPTACAAIVTTENLLVNGGAETGALTPWVSTGGVSVSSSFSSVAGIALPTEGAMLFGGTELATSAPLLLDRGSGLFQWTSQTDQKVLRLEQLVNVGAFDLDSPGSFVNISGDLFGALSVTRVGDGNSLTASLSIDYLDSSMMQFAGSGVADFSLFATNTNSLNVSTSVTAPGSTEWIRLIVRFSVSATSDTSEISPNPSRPADAESTGTFGVDNLSLTVTHASVEPIPEPPSAYTLGGLCLCLSAIGLWRRKSKRGKSKRAA